MEKAKKWIASRIDTQELVVAVLASDYDELYRRWANQKEALDHDCEVIGNLKRELVIASPEALEDLVTQGAEDNRLLRERLDSIDRDYMEFINTLQDRVAQLEREQDERARRVVTLEHDRASTCVKLCDIRKVLDR